MKALLDFLWHLIGGNVCPICEDRSWVEAHDCPKLWDLTHEERAELLAEKMKEKD